MARRALLVGINDYRGISDLKGCLNDVTNVRHILKTYLGFSNSEIRVLTDARATKAAILERLEYMADNAQPGDFMVFHFSGHGSQIRDRDGDDLSDQMDELLCPWDMDWDGKYILDDDLNRIFSRIPQGAMLEMILDCCHSGTGTRKITPPEMNPESYHVSRFLPPPTDILMRQEGEEDLIEGVRGFRGVDGSVSRSTSLQILWSACHERQESADAYINGAYNGAFTYYFCKHFRDVNGAISRSLLLQRVRDSLRHQGFFQVPEIECGDRIVCAAYPFQFFSRDAEPPRRVLSLKTPYMRGEDVRKVQEALARAGYRVSTDGVFGPRTRDVIKTFQRENNSPADGVVGEAVYSLLFGGE